MRRLLFESTIVAIVLYLAIMNFHQAMEVNISNMAAQLAINEVILLDKMDTSHFDELFESSIAEMAKLYEDKSINTIAYVKGKGENLGKHYIIVSVEAYDLMKVLTDSRRELNEKHGSVRNFQLKNYRTDYNRVVMQRLKMSSKRSWTFLLEVYYKKPRLVFGMFTDGWQITEANVVNKHIIKEAYGCMLGKKEV